MDNLGPEVIEDSTEFADSSKNCDYILPPEQICNSIRFKQLLLLKPISIGPEIKGMTNTAVGINEKIPDLTEKKEEVIPGGYLILQPSVIFARSNKTPNQESITNRVTRICKQIERNMPITSAIINGQPPNPDQEKKIKADLIGTKKSISDLSTDDQASIRDETHPVIQLLSRTNSGFGYDNIFDGIEKAINNVLDPGVSQPIESAQPHIALCAVFEQQWCHRGYARGERVATIALAPGEEMTLEIHSWTKETVKSERELIVESEARLSNKLTSRDHFDVANELSTKGHFGADAKIGLTIPVEDIPIGIKAGADISGDLSNTLKTTMERTNERTIEAANTLRSTRKLRIEEARETGRDEKQLRKIVNTNRCHTLNVHYFEILANHQVSLHLTELQTCLLLPVKQPRVTPEWILCNEHILKNVLLDRLFLNGFDGAKTLLMQEQIDEFDLAIPVGGIPIDIGNELSSRIEEECVRLRDDILNDFEVLQDTYDKSKDALTNLANINLKQLPWNILADVIGAMATIGESFPKLIYWGLLKVNANALNTLKALEKSIDRPAIESIRNFFASVTPRDFEYNIVAATITKALDAFGIPKEIVDVIITGGLIDLIADDAGLYVAVKAAHKRIQSLEQPTLLATSEVAEAISSTGFTTESSSFTRIQLAEAKVEYERLKCHVLNNSLHYFHAIWATESGRSLVNFTGYEDLVSPIPVGFIEKKAAFPLLDSKLVEVYFTPESIQNAKTSIESQFIQKPMTITLPTPDLFTEITLGQCNGCEDYIVNSRRIDLNQRSALARQEESELRRREMRIDSGQLGTFEAYCMKNQNRMTAENQSATEITDGVNDD